MGSAPSHRARLWPALALVLNAATWGLSWWPLRQLEARGLHPLWATVLVFVFALAAITWARPRAWLELARTPALWVLVAAAGITNATFNWAVTIGDVVRVVLLFYLMPLWSVLLARVLLGERLTPPALLRVALALAGAAVVLWPKGAGTGGLPLPRSLAEWLGLLGGLSFALNNVMLRRTAGHAEAARALAMFFGGAVVAGMLALALGTQGQVPWPPALAPAWLVGTVVLAAVMLASNLALQYGAARLPANVTAVVMVVEIPIAAASAALLGAGVITVPLLLGGALILGAVLLAGRH
jgi:drug/metabolite transporter (DMT)-like permease